jgi:hypothetical protein
MSDVIFDGGGPSGGGSTPIQMAVDTCAQFFALVTGQLQDIANVRWPLGVSLIPYLNLAIKEVCNVKPEAYTQVFTLPLAHGPRQTLPPGALFLVDLESVLDINGDPISGVTMVGKEQLDKLFAGWYSFPNANDRTVHVIEDGRNPNNFYVFPPAPAATTQSVSLICACFPSEIDSAVTDMTTVDFPLDNSYVPAVLDFTVGYILREETTIPGAQQKSATLFQAGYQKLGVTRATKKQSDEAGV